MEIIENQIPTKIYQNLRVVCGLSFKADEACTIGLGNAIHSVMVKVEGEVIGMGRIIGDGGCFCQIVDICVHPKMQGKGIGKKIMENLMQHIEKELPKTCYISLIADGTAHKLYEKYGFKETMPESRGMYFLKR